MGLRFAANGGWRATDSTRDQSNLYVFGCLSHLDAEVEMRLTPAIFIRRNRVHGGHPFVSGEH